MAAVSIVVLFIAVLAIIVLVGFFGTSQLAKAERSGRNRPVGPSLTYPVPTGVDPATVKNTLSAAGYDAALSEDDQHQPTVVIRSSTDTLDREDVRSTLQQVPFNEGDRPAPVEVRFSDE